MSKTRYAIVGAGHRATTFWGPALIASDRFSAELVAIVEPNRLRLDRARQLMNTDVPGYPDLPTLLDAQTIDGLIVTSPDFTHDEYVREALKAHLSVICEKPLTVTIEKLRGIFEAFDRNSPPLRVSFNYRYAPYATEIRKFLASGELGDVTTVNFQWLLDTVHGADYFRRWHRQKANSGSLFVHKASHHFDLLNWWLELHPQSVYAQATRRIYGPNRSPFQATRCLDCSFGDQCPYHFDLRSDCVLDQLYRQAEEADGYFRDGCVFAPDIDIWDTMTALIRYERDVLVTYTLTAGSPWEGYRVVFNGTRGRLECEIIEASVTEPTWDFSARSAARHRAANAQSPDIIRFYPRFGGLTEIQVPRSAGAHGGGDQRLLEDLFGLPQPDPFKHRAGLRSGVWSTLIGIGARLSAERAVPIALDRLLPEAVVSALPD